jgi:hypothetical protein
VIRRDEETGELSEVQTRVGETSEIDGKDDTLSVIRVWKQLLRSRPHET